MRRQIARGASEAFKARSRFRRKRDLQDGARSRALSQALQGHEPTRFAVQASTVTNCALRSAAELRRCHGGPRSASRPTWLPSWSTMLAAEPLVGGIDLRDQPFGDAFRRALAQSEVIAFHNTGIMPSRAPCAAQPAAARRRAAGNSQRLARDLFEQILGAREFFAHARGAIRATGWDGSRNDCRQVTGVGDRPRRAALLFGKAADQEECGLHA